jgi:hypothetical protein
LKRSAKFWKIKVTLNREDQVFQIRVRVSPMAGGESCPRERTLGRFFKKDSGKGGLTYAEALDEVLCFGWIDGIKKRVDELSYTHRFTPRKLKSSWSRINIQHVERLKKAGRMTPSGLNAYTAREPERSDAYSFENAPRKLAAADEKQFKGDKIAWEFFQRQPPGFGGWQFGGWSARRNRKRAHDGWVN